ncbi:MAG TPA: hypothetical protein VJ302_31805 [Blastocatellia bacterium]|nr:hypothetical protein [Blastocatellia bacterium]
MSIRDGKDLVLRSQYSPDLIILVGMITNQQNERARGCGRNLRPQW